MCTKRQTPDAGIAEIRYYRAKITRETAAPPQSALPQALAKQVAILRYGAVLRRFAAITTCVLLGASISLAQVNFSRLQSVALARYGTQTASLAQQWQAEIEAMRTLPDAEKLARANRFFNTNIRWVSDETAWQKPDYWATPLELMGARMGDCEDFAIAKYLTLVLAGMDVAKLRITYVKLRGANLPAMESQAHMVLAYYAEPRAEPLILDNVIPEIRSASRRTDLTPIYGFNSQGLWVGGAAKPASTEPEARLSRWRDLLRRAAAEGLG